MPSFTEHLDRCRRGPDECWIWPGHVSADGYGRSRHPDHPGEQLAHRVSYLVLVGPIPEGLTLDHVWPRCTSRACINPAHLEPVTFHVNVLRGNNRAAINARRTTCTHGHPFTPENTIPRFRRGRWQRECRLCKNRRLRIARTGEDRWGDRAGRSGPFRG